MPMGHPGAAVGGGGAFDGPSFSALPAAQQRAMFAFWAAPGEFLVRVTHPALVQWLVPAGIYFADPTAAGQSCAASHVLESLLLGACSLSPNAIERGAVTQMPAPPAVRRPLAPALQQLIMSSAPMRNDGTYDMTEPERLAQGALYRRITEATGATLPQPAAIPPPAANAARRATARPQPDLHGNGVRVGEAHVPAPSADTSNADAPAPPPTDTGARSALLRSRNPPVLLGPTRNPGAGTIVPPRSRRRGARPPLFRGGGSLSRHARCVVFSSLRSLRVALGTFAVARRSRRRCLRRRAGAPGAG